MANTKIKAPVSKLTKSQQVLNHLNRKGTITSWEAIEKYGATRLSAIIFNLRKRGMNISTKSVESKDRNGHKCVWAKYILSK